MVGSFVYSRTFMHVYTLCRVASKFQKVDLTRWIMIVVVIIILLLLLLIIILICALDIG